MAGEPDGRMLGYAAPAFFVLALLAVAFAAGVAVGEWRLFPYTTLKGAAQAARDWVDHGGAYLRGDPVQHLRPSRYEGSGVTTAEADRMAPGPTLLTGTWRRGNDWYLGARLVSENGDILHEWRTDPTAVWSSSPHTDIKGATYFGKHLTHIHGAVLMENGDLVLNFEYLGMVRFDACSRPVWQIPNRTHHSVYRADDGSFWTASRRWIETPTYAGLPVPFIDEMILQVSPDGKVLREISVLDAMHRSGYQGLLFATRRDKTVDRVRDRDSDILHLNDVDVLEEKLAGAFPMFRAGDMMVSLRQINTLLVLDGKTADVKWSMTHPFIRQHDPDFAADGTITVFDNRKDDSWDGGVFGGSRILEVDPAARTAKVIYPTADTPTFFTNIMGKQQMMPNGNLLITESDAGRAFEVTPSGEIVWSYVNRWNEHTVGIVEQATRYPPGYADFDSAACRADAAPSA